MARGKFLARKSLKETAEYLTRGTGVRFNPNQVAEIEKSAFAKIKKVLDAAMATKVKEVEAWEADEGIDFTDVTHHRRCTRGTSCETRRTSVPSHTNRSQTV